MLPASQTRGTRPWPAWPGNSLPPHRQPGSAKASLHPTTRARPAAFEIYDLGKLHARSTHNCGILYTGVCTGPPRSDYLADSLGQTRHPGSLPESLGPSPLRPQSPALASDQAQALLLSTHISQIYWEGKARLA